jgi:SAM-dependent methyltransferase
MARQRLDEWVRLDETALAYHCGQWDKPKEMTRQFEQFVAARFVPGELVIDLGCGSGAPTAYLAERHPQTRLLGLDVSAELIATAAQVARHRGISNLSFLTADWYNLPASLPAADGIVSMQTLSWLPDMEEPLTIVCAHLRPRWFAMSSLFFTGDISCHIEVHEHKRSRNTFYNCYALPAVERLAHLHAYHIVEHVAFEMPFDLPQPDNPDLMGTYTVKVAGRATPQRLQISGPLLMNWRFVCLEQRGRLA